MAKYIKKKITMCINNVEKGGGRKTIFIYLRLFKRSLRSKYYFNK